MRKFWKKLKDNELLLDSLNVILGLVLIAALAVFFISQAYIALLAAVWAAGFMNMVNGVKAARKKKGGTLGQSMVMLGMFIVVGGTMLIFSAMGLF